MLLLTTAYFAPIPYYAQIAQCGQIILEKHEHYNRQSYRNRCTVLAANGLLDLVVPVAKSGQAKTPVAEQTIAYHTPWQKHHFRAIESAYRRSPFYEYYIDDLLPFFHHQHTYLYEMNLLIMQQICTLLQLPLAVHESNRFITHVEGNTDCRYSIHPKQQPSTAADRYNAPRYTQLFADRWGFVPNLSILDLLFNAGPESGKLLRRSTRRNPSASPLSC